MTIAKASKSEGQPRQYNNDRERWPWRADDITQRLVSGKLSPFVLSVGSN